MRLRILPLQQHRPEAVHVIARMLPDRQYQLDQSSTLHFGRKASSASPKLPSSRAQALMRAWSYGSK
jgi:hypothetical protein